MVEIRGTSEEIERIKRSLEDSFTCPMLDDTSLCKYEDCSRNKRGEDDFRRCMNDNISFTEVKS